jgi:hypothetical protein
MVFRESTPVTPPGRYRIGHQRVIMEEGIQPMILLSFHETNHSSPAAAGPTSCGQKGFPAGFRTTGRNAYTKLDARPDCSSNCEGRDRRKTPLRGIFPASADGQGWHRICLPLARGIGQCATPELTRRTEE